MRYVFFGSPPYAPRVFERLLASDHEVLALVTGPERRAGRGRKQRPSPLVELAELRPVPVYRPENPHEEHFLGELAAAAPDVFVIASYGKLMKPALFDLPPAGSLNVHASLLPRWRGASPIQAAIRAGDAETGVSIQRIVMELDAGDVLLERSTKIAPEETAGELLERLAALGGEAIVDALDRVQAGTAAFTPQDEAQVTWARKLAKDAGRIDWSRPADEIARHVRAMTPWPGARSSDPKARALTLLCVRALPTAGTEPARESAPGTILEAGQRLVVATGVGALEILELQAAGKRALPAAEFMRGARLEPGDRLE